MKYSLSYSDAIDKLDGNTLDRSENTHLKLFDETPQLYIDKAGAKNLKIIMGWDIAYLAMRKSGDIPGNYHGLGVNIMREIPKAIEDPLYIIKQKNGRIAAITEIVVKGKKPVFVSIELDAYKATKQDGVFEDENYNLVVTVMDAHPRYLKNTVFSGEIVYNKNNEAPANFILRLKTLNKAVPDDDLAKASNNSIRNPEQKVNKNSLRYQKNESARAYLQEQNASMGEDVAGLNQLVEAQRRRNTTDHRKSALLNARGYARQVGDDDPFKVSDEAN